MYSKLYNKSIACFTDLEMNKDPKEKEADMFASYFLAPYEALSLAAKVMTGKEVALYSVNMADTLIEKLKGE